MVKGAGGVEPCSDLSSRWTNCLPDWKLTSYTIVITLCNLYSKVKAFSALNLIRAEVQNLEVETISMGSRDQMISLHLKTQNSLDI